MAKVIAMKKTVASKAMKTVASKAMKTVASKAMKTGASKTKKTVTSKAMKKTVATKAMKKLMTSKQWHERYSKLFYKREMALRYFLESCRRAPESWRKKIEQLEEFFDGDCTAGAFQVVSEMYDECAGLINREAKTNLRKLLKAAEALVDHENSDCRE